MTLIRTVQCQQVGAASCKQITTGWAGLPAFKKMQYACNGPGEARAGCIQLQLSNERVGGAASIQEDERCMQWARGSCIQLDQAEHLDALE